MSQLGALFFLLAILAACDIMYYATTGHYIGEAYIGQIVDKWEISKAKRQAGEKAID